MTVSVNAVEIEGLGYLYNNIGKTSAEADKKTATNVMRNPGRALGIETKIGSSAVS